jgi:S-adenosylmethionine:tRNA ribosyltransferase-isomerase
VRTAELDYHLPPELIAREPVTPRDHCRLLVYHQTTGQMEHAHFYDLPRWLTRGDLLVLNNTWVVPAKLRLYKPTGACIEGLYIDELQPGTWRVLLNSRGRLQPGMYLTCPSAPETVRFDLTERVPGTGEWLVQVTPPLPARQLLATIGQVPLPPYIEHARQEEGRQVPPDQDVANYQTIYAGASPLGPSIAAPTAGLHFTPELFAKVGAMGVRRCHVELQVGLGTFLPVKTATLAEHTMHSERFMVPADTLHALAQQRKRGRQIIAVGTTTVRTLEAAAAENLRANDHQDLKAQTDILIQPGHAWQLTDGMITNFHLPKSTLLALVAAKIGLDEVKRVYAEAIAQRYRFYSYGDAMLIVA